MSVGPGEILILLLVLAPMLALVGGIGALVYFLMRNAKRRCGACGMPNLKAKQACPRCGAVV